MDPKPFEESFDLGVYGTTRVTAADLEVQKVFELENALPDLPFEEQLGDLRAQGAAGMTDQLNQDSISTPSPPPVQTSPNVLPSIKEEASDDQEASASLQRSVSEEVEELNSESEAPSHPVDDTQPEVQNESFVLDKPECAHSSAELQILNAEFVESQYVFKHTDKNPFYEIKGKKIVQLKLSSELLDYQWIFTGLFHSHPEFSCHPIWAPSKESFPYKRETPFNVHVNDPGKVVHLETEVQQMNLKFKGAMILLTNENILNFDYLVNSTDKNNFGQKKNAKEWQQIIVPLTPLRAQEMLNGSKLTLEDLVLASRIRVQIREEMRKTTLSKENRSIEISFPLPTNLRKRRLKEQIIKAKRARLDLMTEEELEIEAKSLGIQAV